MNRILKINILIIIILFLLTTVCQALNATVSTNISNVKIGEEFKLIITFDEKVVATNFDINYDNGAFEFIQGDNINAAEKDGKIVCIYADSTLVGTNSFSITFKAIKEGSNSAFGIDNAKIRVNGQEVSNHGEDVDGLYCIRSVEVIKEDNNDDSKKDNNTEENKRESYSNTITNKNNTQAEKVIPKAGFNYTIFIAIIIAIAFCAISKIKFNNINKILPVIIFASIIWINSSVFAANEDITIKKYNNLIENEKVFAVMLPNNTENLYITATELESIIKERFDYTITSINQDDKTTLSSSNKVNTGAQIDINGEKYIALIYGDANGDGTICDIDDLMIIIKDFLGIKNSTGIYRIAADLATEDNLNVLDSDDLMQMIKMYLGQLKGDLVQVLPNENEIILNIEDYSNVAIGGGYSWKYKVYSDGTVKGEKWTSGSVLNFVSEKIKEYTVTLTSEELEFLKDIENKYVKGITPENNIQGIKIENKDEKTIDTTKLTVTDFNTLKSIIEKITEFREEIVLSYNDTYKPCEIFHNYTYNIDIYSQKIIYNKKCGGFYMNQTRETNNIKQTEKSLTEGQITKIKELYRKIKNNSNKYEISSTDFNMINENHYYTIDSHYMICEKEDVQMVDSIVSNMDNIEGIEAKISNSISQTCTISLESNEKLGRMIKLAEKGYDFIEIENYYYMIITAGEKPTSNYYLVVSDIDIESDDINIYATENETRETTMSQTTSYPYSIIKFNKKPQQKITLNMKNDEEYKKINLLDFETICDKPVIYIYPEKETNVTLKVEKPEYLTCSYPKYENGWNVIAKPNGDLIDCKTGRNLYCLYWEGINTVKPNLTEGFIVKGEDTSKFLEEKLEILGLNSKETNEFIIYWLPQLENNKYNFIRFQTMNEINKNMPLEISPIPDTIIRVMMEWKALEKPIDIREQNLEKRARSGFSVVEWGGTEVK